MLFLSSENIQLPYLVPLVDYPSSPSPEAAAQLSIALRHCVEAVDAAKVVFVWERCQNNALTDTDKAWAKTAVEACRLVSVALRAQLVSHRAGVRWLAPDDWL
jgi:sarcosine oxidase gamma subunit